MFVASHDAAGFPSEQNTNGNIMKIQTKILVGLCAVAASAICIIAQDSSPADGPGGPRGRGGPGGPGQRPVPPLMAALDANHDGVIDADEIKNAPAALLTLDKNGDGKLTQDELRPPGHGPGGFGGPGGPGGGDRPPGPPPADN